LYPLKGTEGSNPSLTATLASSIFKVIASIPREQRTKPVSVVCTGVGR
jgi:hypothetical protein